MSENASAKAEEYLKELGVNVFLQSRVKDFDGEKVYLDNWNIIPTKTLVWAAGVTGNLINGLNNDVFTFGNRIKVDKNNKVDGYSTVFAIGDIAFMSDKEYPQGHPQVAQVAIQQATTLATNFINLQKNKPLKAFVYNNLGSMATIGRNKAVADFKNIQFAGFFAWLIWMFIHLMSLVGFKNRLFAFINWAWSYVTFDQPLRLIIKPKQK
jgi:NADH dehydrogenase